jgi:hypothetical protein
LRISCCLCTKYTPTPIPTKRTKTKKNKPTVLPFPPLSPGAPVAVVVFTLASIIHYITIKSDPTKSIIPDTTPTIVGIETPAGGKSEMGVGEIVGITVGLAVGLSVGEGDLVGTGLFVGLADGVGDFVGVRVGLAVGTGVKVAPPEEVASNAGSSGEAKTTKFLVMLCKIPAESNHDNVIL